jgi:plasmid stabilization system protein ParE
MKKEYSVRWTSNANGDVREIVSYIKTHTGETTARNCYKKIKGRVLPLEDYPGMGHCLPLLAKIGIMDVK